MTVHKTHNVTCNQGHIQENQTKLLVCPECNEKPQLGWKTTTIRKSDLTQAQLTSRLLTYLDESGFFDHGGDYGELQSYDAYNNESHIIITADWNNKKYAKIGDWIESNIDNIEIGWCDEYARCECGKFVQTSPDSYSWQANFIMTEYSLICRECIENEHEPDALIEEYENTDNKAIPSWGIDIITEAGFACLDDMLEDNTCTIFQSGWYPGQTDSPANILSELETEFGFPVEDKFDRIWIIDSIGQFDINFSLFLREKEID